MKYLIYPDNAKFIGNCFSQISEIEIFCGLCLGKEKNRFQSVPRNKIVYHLDNARAIFRFFLFFG